jgi:hypothetical protein
MPTHRYAQYDQVFVILRADTANTHSAPETAVGLVKALWNAAAADAEVARLMQLNRAPETVYFWKAARLERRLTEADSPPSLTPIGPPAAGTASKEPDTPLVSSLSRISHSDAASATAL